MRFALVAVSGGYSLDLVPELLIAVASSVEEHGPRVPALVGVHVGSVVTAPGQILYR